MNIRGNFPWQASFTFLRKAIASKPLLPKETQTAITFSIGNTTTKNGLKINAELDTNGY
jgi:hypothetical protein